MPIPQPTTLLKMAIATLLTASASPSPPAGAAASRHCDARVETFSPGVVSVPELHDDYVTFSPDGRRLVITRLKPDYTGGTLYGSSRTVNGWSRPVPLPFSGTYADSRATFSPDGRSLIFSSDRPHTAGGTARGDLDLWRAEWDGNAWRDPKPLAGDVNTGFNETHPSLANDGTLYFVRWGRGMPRRNDIFSARRTSSGWIGATPVEALNSDLADSHVWVDPRQRFILFARGVPDQGDDVFVSRREGSGWGPPERLSAAVNSASFEYSAKVGPAGDRLYFSRNGQWTGARPADIVSVPLCAVPQLTGPRSSGRRRTRRPS